MSARDTLTPELRAEVLRLEDDLRARVASLPEVQSVWREEYDAARAAERTAAAWEAWVDERVTLAAVAWVLTTVFVRFCEDNALVKPVWISGPRSREAIEAQQQFLRETARVNADVTDREWLLEAVNHLKSLRATAGLVDETSPMWLIEPSGDAVTRLLSFWRERDDSGHLLRDLSDPGLDTRFLGDLYQEISEDAKKRYALLQTPVFVEEFILDRTLEPAINERPLEGFKMIDPTCGSGHFLLGGFQRLLDRWHQHAPGLDERERVQAALDSVYGVDLNPFAVAIARFRLTVAALQACGMTTLEDAPAFNYHLASGDSLLYGVDQLELDLGAEHAADQVAAKFAYATENLGELVRILKPGAFDAVVGNPPYIAVSDPYLSAAYRLRYATCMGTYPLSVPFVERFFSLARRGATPGWIGQITSNSFMKRKSGSRLIEKFLPSVDLREVIDSEGAWIPGHNMDGTPTVILVGRNAAPASDRIRAVLSKGRRESQADRNGTGPYWSALTSKVDEVGYEDDWVSVAWLAREGLASHPWSLSGDGAMDVLEALDSARHSRLKDHVVEMGRTTNVGEDDAWFTTMSVARRKGLVGQSREFVVGEGVRDFLVRDTQTIWWPYVDVQAPSWVADSHPLPSRVLWPNRTLLSRRTIFGKTFAERGRPWFDHLETYAARLRTDRFLSYPEVASHNHFAMVRGEYVFKQTAPVLKLVDGASDERYAELLGALNSSTALFWMRQVCKAKGGAADHTWARTYQFNTTTVQEMPFPPRMPSERGVQLDSCAQALGRALPRAFGDDIPTRETLDSMRRAYDDALGQLILLQEELDWEMYAHFGLVDSAYATLPGAGILPTHLRAGERAFELAMVVNGATPIGMNKWFEVQGVSPVLKLPGGWSEEYRELVQRRMGLIRSDKGIGLLESPDHKRPWLIRSWEDSASAALEQWLLDRLDRSDLWVDSHGRSAPCSIAVLADKVARDIDVMSVLALWEGRPDVNVLASLTKLLAHEAVPFLAAYRYLESGLRKRAAWEHAWSLQRREDAGSYNPAPASQGGDGPIAAPPKYIDKDFAMKDYWSLRGKLDVPKERLILYPNAGREGDATFVVGWAGWDHAQQSLALATLIQTGEQQGWPEARLLPLVAGLAELLPWVEQWHSDPDALYGGSSPAEFFSGLLDTYMAKIGVTRETLSQWRPPAPTRGRKAKS